VTGRPFRERVVDGYLVLSRTGRNLARILEAIGTTVDEITYVEAVKCRPGEACAWTPGESTRRRCLPFLEAQILAVRPRLILALGVVATASCFEIAGIRLPRPFRLGGVVGRVERWRTPWCRPCLVVPLYHPSSANGGRWPHDLSCLRTARSKFGASRGHFERSSGAKRFTIETVFTARRS
jgi:uracil-DNA glycosylase family 4